MATLIAQIIGFKGKILWDDSKPDGTPKKQLDIGRIHQLGWRPKISLEKGLKDTINSYLEQKG